MPENPMKFTHTHKFAPVFLLALLLTGFSPALVVGQSDKVPPVRSPAEETSPPPAQETSYHYLGRSLDQKINELDWGEGASVSLYVADLDHNLAVFEHNADQPMPPASIMKLFLAAGAIQILGPEYRFQTEMLATGEPFKQRLKGDWLKSNCLKGEVWVKGDGDPSITSSLAQNPDAAYALFDSWAAMLKSKRIHAIEGPILLDTSAFDSQGYPTGWPEENVAPPQFPEISPINFNDNCFDIYWRPTNRSEGKVAPHSIFPALPRFIHFSNNIKVLSGHNPSRKFERALGTNVISATGYILPGTKAYDRATLAHPAEYFGEALKDRLGQKGILISGSVRFGTLPAPKRGSEGAPGSKTLLPGSAAESTTPSQPAAPAPSLEIHDLHQSPPLREIIQNMLRDDRTLDAEVILKAIGRKRSGRAGTTADGAAAVMDFIRSRRLANAGFVMMDGSGMSR
ncbi:D-alanyl-D-alanine carboxypeptidase, partial [Candidatus Sumerlaeota bacterium]|nr:D-alanyl-D-alanine carboxypeptidase [Candidatus Sumerlaeota bacterium]